MLLKINVGDRYDRERLGNEIYHVTFPFVHHENNQPVKVIKPLHLAHKEPTKIYEHGAAWIYRINKLKGEFLDPRHVLFTLAGPEKDENRLEAYHDIEKELQDTGVETVAFDNPDEITQFVLN